ncbi:MAG: epoxyqueuosine reductase QueH [Clostridia bacterium]|nr:epoxyqueuosine reductase QueH [Clostridia bacterium]
MEGILSGDRRLKVLLHSCCAPCSSHCISVLAPRADVTVFYYNPNIYPESEYLRRKQEQIRLIDCAFKDVNFIDGDYDTDAFYRAAKGYESCPEGGQRCFKCFELRLSRAAEVAKRIGCDLFATTLTVSPHKNSTVINAIGKEIAIAAGVEFLPSDFKKKDGYKHSLQLSEQYGLYRQNYCGCEFSYRRIEER